MLASTFSRLNWTETQENNTLVLLVSSAELTYTGIIILDKLVLSVIANTLNVQTEVNHLPCNQIVPIDPHAPPLGFQVLVRSVL